MVGRAMNNMAYMTVEYPKEEFFRHCELNELSAVERYLKESRFDPAVKNKVGQTGLHRVVLGWQDASGQDRHGPNQKSIIRALLSNGRFVSDDAKGSPAKNHANDKDKHKNTAFFYACSKLDAESVKALLDFPTVDVTVPGNFENVGKNMPPLQAVFDAKGTEPKKIKVLMALFANHNFLKQNRGIDMDKDIVAAIFNRPLTPNDIKLIGEARKQFDVSMICC